MARQGRLWRGNQAIALRPQSLAMLRYLVEHPGRLVTKAELRQHVWAGTHVSDTVLRVSVHEIRQALGTVRRRQLHRAHWRAAGDRLWPRAGELAAQLMVHFERGGATFQAVCYAQQAAENAARRNAHHEAITALRGGPALLATLPESPEHSRHELALLLTLGELLRTTKGLGAPDVGNVYTRAIP